jgi:phosphatidylglycerol:prolipoprotein diacylglycerol transferase
MSLPFPNIDPIALQLGPVAIRWYALAYIGGILGGWKLAEGFFLRRAVLSKQEVGDLVSWIILGVILGGRLGYVCFYQPGYYLEHPLHALHIWQGGMSFHGGLIGVITAVWGFCLKKKVPFFSVMDCVAIVTPIGLLLGRIANFINGELFGRVSDVPWAVRFPHGGYLPRHPSQLYEAATEGLLLFLLLYLLARCTLALGRHGMLSGVFLTGYATARMGCELFREPDAYLGFLLGPLTMGHLLSLPMLGLGLFLITRALLRKP